MDTIQMVDLKNQYLKIKPEIDSAIQRIISTSAFIKGEDVAEFEKELANYLDVNHVIGCANGTDALQMALMALDLKPGDEVITTPFTFISTAEAIALLGLTPVFVDIDAATFNMDYNLIEKAITKKTRVILPVHLFGQSAGMEKIIQLAHAFNLYVIEDNAQALGADYFFSTQSAHKKKAGTIGHIGCTSFFPSKVLGCFGDGGAVFTNNEEVAHNIACIGNHGTRVKYIHDRIGINSRLDTMQAAILRVKLKYLDEHIAARRKVADMYDLYFKGHPNCRPPVRSKFSSHVFHQYTLTIDGANRDELKAYLQKRDIPSMVYYPIPLHKQKVFKYRGYSDLKFIVAEKASQSVLSLPIHTEMDSGQVEYVATKVLDFFKQV